MRKAAVSAQTTTSLTCASPARKLTSSHQEARLAQRATPPRPRLLPLPRPAQAAAKVSRAQAAVKDERVRLAAPEGPGWRRRARRRRRAPVPPLRPLQGAPCAPRAGRCRPPSVPPATASPLVPPTWAAAGSARSWHATQPFVAVPPHPPTRLSAPLAHTGTATSPPAQTLRW